MHIRHEYSHLNGLEWLLVHAPAELDELREVVGAIDAGSLQRISTAADTAGETKVAPTLVNEAFKAELEGRGWAARRTDFALTSEVSVLRAVQGLPADLQRDGIRDNGLEALRSHAETDFAKGRVAAEVQFGHYTSISHDLFVKHQTLFSSGEIDVGVEIVPTKAMLAHLSSGPGYYEQALGSLVRAGRGVPSVPLLVIGIDV